MSRTTVGCGHCSCRSPTRRRSPPTTSRAKAVRSPSGHGPARCSTLSCAPSASATACPSWPPAPGTASSSGRLLRSPEWAGRFRPTNVVASRARGAVADGLTRWSVRPATEPVGIFVVVHGHAGHSSPASSTTTAAPAVDSQSRRDFASTSASSPVPAPGHRDATAPGQLPNGSPCRADSRPHGTNAGSTVGRREPEGRMVRQISRDVVAHRDLCRRARRRGGLRGTVRRCASIVRARRVDRRVVLACRNRPDHDAPR